ncbi:unnamed protein product [Oreochromis niloticus]|nr:unnamed protein product [Mustela putorius furo]
MGKFQSKHASKPRQSPEGRSLASSVLRESQSSHICRRKLTENLYVELRKSTSDHNCDMKVVLPPEEEKTPDKGTNFHFECKKETKRRSSRAAGTEGNVLPGDDSQQEWTFTLYNFDNTDEVTKEDMSSLMHSVFEVLETSVKQPCSGTRPLRIKLAVTSSNHPSKSSNTDAEQEQSGSQEAGRPMRRLFCVDENKERRKHYQDLAGIENYASKFDNPADPCVIGPELRESPAGCMAGTLLRGATLPRLSFQPPRASRVAPTAGSFTPRYNILPRPVHTLASRHSQDKTGRRFTAFSLPVVSRWPRDMSTITSMSIITIITTTTHHNLM